MRDKKLPIKVKPYKHQSEAVEFAIKTMGSPQQQIKPIVRMPIKVKPYQHQVDAFNFAMRIFGLDTYDSDVKFTSAKGGG